MRGPPKADIYEKGRLIVPRVTARSSAIPEIRKHGSDCYDQLVGSFFSICANRTLLRQVAIVLLWAGSPFACAADLAGAPADVSAAQPDTTSAVLQEVTVTAQRREENAQRIPVSIQAISGDTLATMNVQSALDLQKVVPSALIQANQFSVTTFLRGIGSNIPTLGNEASNAVYVDGIYYSHLSSSILRLNNVDRIEVLEGPQGTLFGRNASGGLINIITRTPELSASPRLDASFGYGSFRTVNANTYASSGFGDAVAGDVAINYYNNPGFGHNIYNNSAAAYERALSLRSKWVFEPSDSSKLTVGGEYNHSKSDIGVATQYPGGPRPGLGNTGLPVTGGLLGPLGYFDRNQDFANFVESDIWGVNGRFDLDLGLARFVEIAAFHHETGALASDADYTPQFANNAYVPVFTRLFTNELQLLSEPGSAVEWVGGFYYLHDVERYENANLTGFGYGAPPAGALVIDSGQTVSSYALYGQATMPIVSDLKLTLGGRYNNDLTRGTGGIDVRLAPDTIITAVPPAWASHRTQQFSWKTALDYEFDRQTMAYASVSRGYKAGLYNILTFDPNFVRPEILTAYEIGAKADLFGARLRLNPAIFYYRVANPQSEVDRDGLNVLLNAGREEIRGAELKGEAAITDQLRVEFGAVYLDARYTEFDGVPAYTPAPAPFFGLSQPVPIDASGNRPSHAPTFSGNIAVAYNPTSSLSLSANYGYTGAYYWAPDNRVRQGSVGLVDAQVTYRISKTGASIKLWGSNLTDKRSVLFLYEQAGSAGDISAPAPPRQYGVTVQYVLK